MPRIKNIYLKILLLSFALLAFSVISLVIKDRQSTRGTNVLEGTFSIRALELNYTSQSPVTLLMSLENIIDMRFENTPSELSYALWEPYTPTKEWILKTGPGSKVVYAEFRDTSQTLFSKTAQINVGLVTNTFDQGQEHWWTYNYREVPGYNTFYPTTWESSGGINNSGYIKTDDSRWSIDDPEVPNSILALLTYPSWAGMKAIDLRGTRVSFYLRGTDLDLKGAQVFFWVHSRARWHYTAQPLQVSQGTWGNKVTFTLLNDESLWHKTYTSDARLSSLDYTLGVAESYGLSFIGFPPGQKVTGQLSLDQFEIAPAR